MEQGILSLSIEADVVAIVIGCMELVGIGEGARMSSDAWKVALVQVISFWRAARSTS